jgi:DNA-directed RNA polymerase specialized sigma24 family protein
MKRKHARRLDAEMQQKEAPTRMPNQIVEEVYPFLRRVATEKVALYQATNGIEPGYMDPDEIVDEVLVERIESVDPEAGMAEVKRQLFEGILAAIKRHVAEYEADSANLVSTELDIPELDEKIELSTLGDEVLDFWVLDEDLLLEDVIESPDHRTPEEIVADKEARHVLLNALLRLSPRARYIFSSYVMDDNSISDVAAFVGEKIEQTEEALRDATRRLRSLLTERENLLTEDGVLALYRRMADMFQVDPERISQAGKVKNPVTMH